jgi:hypothetical protein
VQEKDEKLLLLQSEAFDKFGQEGEDAAVDLLSDCPELADSADEFWQRMKAELDGSPSL